jgi:hypothetical protein
MSEQQLSAAAVSEEQQLSDVSQIGSEQRTQLRSWFAAQRRQSAASDTAPSPLVFDLSVSSSHIITYCEQGGRSVRI